MGDLAGIKLLIQDGKADAAIRACEDLLSSGEEDYGVLACYGAALCTVGRDAEALTVLGRARDLRPDRAASWYNIGRVLEHSGQPQEALVCYRRALSSQPQHILAKAGVQRVANQASKLDEQSVGLVESAVSRPLIGGGKATRDTPLSIPVRRSYQLVLTWAAILSVVVAAAYSLVGGSWGRHDRTDVLGRVAPVLQGSQTPDAKDTSLVMALVGDVLPIGTSDPLRRVAGMLNSADITFCNLECPISSRGSPTPLKFRNGHLMQNEFLFRAPERAAAIVGQAGIDVVSLANNHMMDYGAEALSDTFALLAGEGIAYAGAGADAETARSFAVVERKGIRVAFLAYVLPDTLPGTQDFAATEHNPGLSFLNSYGGSDVADMLRRDIVQAKKSASVVVVSYHWGRECTTRPTPEQQRLGHLTVDCGADMVVGHHPHCLQGIEVYKGKPIIYSLGNFVFPSRRDLLQRTGIFWVRMSSDGVRKVTFRGVWIQGASPRPSGPAEAMASARVMQRLCRELGTHSHLAERDNCTMMSIELQSDGFTHHQNDAAYLKGVPSDLVDVSKAVPDVVLDLRYSGTHNVFGKTLYESDKCFLRNGTAVKLARAQELLSLQGLRLKVWDGYRPIAVQKQMWEMMPDARYVANPLYGSNHNRGAAVDVTLVDANGKELAMPSDFDDFSERARVNYAGTPAPRRRNSALLRKAMSEAGFRQLSTEWWHFDDTEARRYGLEKVSLNALAGR